MSVTQQRKACIKLVSCSVWLVSCSRHIKRTARQRNKQINVKQEKAKHKPYWQRPLRNMACQFAEFFLMSNRSSQEEEGVCVFVCVCYERERRDRPGINNAVSFLEMWSVAGGQQTASFLPDVLGQERAHREVTPPISCSPPLLGSTDAWHKYFRGCSRWHLSVYKHTHMHTNMHTYTHISKLTRSHDIKLKIVK